MTPACAYPPFWRKAVCGCAPLSAQILPTSAPLSMQTIHTSAPLSIKVMSQNGGKQHDSALYDPSVRVSAILV
ncbi:hypothetical protein, partial [Arcanobacterium phocae]|uniref:hypothetical protein n=1 Tax=Arcanobacterium phocae TaxID=131112 RepID=UPI001C11604F